VPVTAAMVQVTPFLVMGLVWRDLAPVAAGVPVVMFMNLRRGLELSESDALVRSPRAVRVPWSSVTGVCAGPWWWGGIILQTRSFEDVSAPAPCSWWGGPADAARVSEVEAWWVEHRGPAWTERPPYLVPPHLRRPVARYRTAVLSRSLSVVGLLVAAANAAALWWPAGTFSVLFVEFAEPELDGLGWLMIGATGGGLVLGVVWGAWAHRILRDERLPMSPADSYEKHPRRLLAVLTAIALSDAALQWLGLVPAAGSLLMMTVGLAAAVAGPVLSADARQTERRTEAIVLSSNPLSRALGLELGQPNPPERR
jgi:hypothetical protein